MTFVKKNPATGERPIALAWGALMQKIKRLRTLGYEHHGREDM